MNSITINGKTITAPAGSSISVNNNDVYIDGVKTDVADSKVINIEIVGNVGALTVDSAGTISVTGDVNKIDSTAGDIRCGDVRGNVKSMSGDVTAQTIHGKVRTMSGDVRTR